MSRPAAWNRTPTPAEDRGVKLRARRLPRNALSCSHKNEDAISRGTVSMGESAPLWAGRTVGGLSSRRIYKAQPLLPSSDGWTRCPYPCTGPGCQFVVFSFDSSYLIVTSFGTLLSVIFRTIQGAICLLLLPIPSHQCVRPVTDGRALSCKVSEHPASPKSSSLTTVCTPPEASSFERRPSRSWLVGDDLYFGPSRWRPNPRS
jgi:hypothetical protein